MSFPPSFYEQLEDRLNLAVFDTNQEFRMWRLETIKAELGDIPESATLTVTNDGREQLLTYNARTIRIDQYETIDQIRARLNLEKIDRLTKPTTSKRMSNYTGLEPGTWKAKLAGIKQKVADSQNAAVAKVDATIGDGLQKLEAAADDYAQKAKAELDNALHDFAQDTNGPPTA